MQVALQQFASSKNVNDFITKLETTLKNDPNVAMGWAFVGAHYMSTVNNPDKCREYLLKSIQINPNPVAVYNLGYHYEQKIRKEYDNQFELEMLKYYKMAIEMNMKQAYNQIGSYYIDRDQVPVLGGTPESYLLMAYNAGIFPALNNLIKLHHNNYDKCSKYMLEKYNRTNDVMHLMEYILYMLNNHKYADYCKFMKKIGKNNMDMSVLLGTQNFITCECPICMTEKKCIKMNCSHVVCNDCIFKIFTEVDAKCPFCRISL